MENRSAFSANLSENETTMKKLFGASFDVKFRRLVINGAPAFGVYADGMCDEMKIAKTVLLPLTAPETFVSREHTGAQICLFGFKGADLNVCFTVEETAKAILSGSYALFLEGEAAAYTFGVQGYAKKAVGEPPSEENEFGSQEGFTDNLKDNAALLRRRLQEPALVLERANAGGGCSTPILICYLSDSVDRVMLETVKYRIREADLKTVLGSGWLRPFLNGNRKNVFSGSGITERPDLLAAKLTEGRIGVIVDGTPFAVIVPYLFADYFHSMDDYLVSPVYALFIRALRYLCFFTAVCLPGMFVAACVFHPKMLPSDIMYDIAAAEAKTPFPLAVEAITIHLIYEVVREAGLRMPHAVGHAVSIVGALVIGDAAVSAGLIAAPMLIVVGITTISAAVISKLHDRIAVLRLLLIAAGGLTGFFGVFLGAAFLLIQMCAVSPFGVPFTAPFSPNVPEERKDALFRAPWKRLARQRKEIGALKF